MSNFTRSGRRAKIWQSITNLSCCSIDLMTKQSKSMKALAFILLFAFSTSTMFAQQDLDRSTFFNRCQDDAPPGPTEADVANLYLNQCGDIPATVVKSTLMEGNDCAWTVEYTYDVKCGSFEEQIKIDYQGGDLTAPELNDGAVVPTGGQDLNLCFSDAPVGPSIADITELYSDNCSEVFVTKSGNPEGTDCQWEAIYTYTIKDACDNFADDLVIVYNGGDSQAPVLGKDAEIPSDQYGIEACFLDKPAGPTVEDIAALYVDNCGLVNVTKSTVSKGTDCKWMAEFTYTIKDDCENFADSIVITYYGGDTEAPVLSGVPGDITVNCADEVPAPDFKSVSATDNCATKLEILVSDEPSQVDSCLGGTIVRTYSVSDDCGYSDSQTQTITVLPTPEATLAEILFISNISCEEAANFEAPNLPYNNGVQSGACAVSGSLEPNVNAQYTECGGTITVSYDGLDSCDRPLSAGPFVITVDPAPAAEFEGVQDMEVSCEEAASIEAGSLSYTNGGTGVCEISGSVPGELSGSYDECGGTLYIDWIYTDDCERTITAKKTITVLPAPAAEFEGVEDMEISCEEANSFEAGSLSYTNGGTGACEISGSVAGELSGSYDECGGTLTVNWTYTDDCQRTITASKTVTVLPAPAAEFEEVLDMEISCEEANSFEAGSLSYTNGGTGACEISGSVPGELSGSYDECGGTLYVDWVFTDDCERTITAKKTITVLPAPMAEFEEVLDMEISCEEANSFEPSSLSYTNGGTGVCEISGSVPGELSGSYTECGGTLYVDWTYTDACERTITAQKVITVLPAPVAEFEFVDHITISCEEANSYEASSLAYTNGGTGVCEISGSVPGELSGEYSECGGLLFVDWTYTDDCQRTITARLQIKVNPAPQAEFEEVLDMEISCEEANSFEPSSLSYTNGGTGVCEISGSVEGELSGSYTECGGTLFVDWTYTDDCQRTITAKKTITVLPAPMAEFDEIQDISISCESANLYQAAPLAYTNGGTGACEISGSVQGELSGSYTECGGTLYVDWTFTDDCERTITARKTITVEPAPMAEFEEVLDMEISCEEANIFEAGSLSYTNGGTGACEISGSVPGELSGSYTECGGTLYVDWTYTDDCERTITAKKTITVLPAPMAEIVNGPGDIEISCEQANGYVLESLNYSNGGTGACEISGSIPGELSGTYDECGGDLLATWIFVDECGRELYYEQFITVLPAPMAEFDEVLDMEISCEEANSFEAGSLSYTNGGTGVCEISGSVAGELSGSYDECGGTLYVDWTYTDDCQRTITAKKTITVLPAPAAEFEEVLDMEISCEEANSFQAGSLSYTNGGTGVCEISGSVQGELSGSYTYCGGTLYVDWTYTDECERTITAQKVITVLPAPMAEFEEVLDMEISCEEANVFEPGSLSYTNGGTGLCEISGSVEGELSGSYTECGGTLYVDWTYTDDCQRTITAKKTITVLPAPMAEFDGVEDISISCEAANLYQAASLAYTNGGTGACEISGSVQGELSGSYTECGGTLYVDWTFTDDCERTITARKTITVEPAPIAEFEEVLDMEISCEEANIFEAGSLSYTNGGTGVCEISGSVPGELSGSYDECGGTLYVDWTYTDDCERTITAKKTITVLPAPAAEFEEVLDMEISCEEANSFQAGSLSYTNGGTGVCEISGSVQGEATPDYDECGGVIIVNWTYTDDCQRTITASKTVTVLPAPAAEFEEVLDMEISCEEANSFEAGSLSYTNGGTGVCEISGSVLGELSGSYNECGGTLYVDWTYTDDCNRTITAKKTITVLPAPAAEFEEVQDMEISCEEANSFQAGPLSYTNGGTGVCEISGSQEGEATPDYDECGGVIIVNWTYTDDCQRTITATKTVTVLPAPAAEFEEVLDMEISCEEANSFEAGSLSYTNGGTGVCEISGSVEGELSGSYTYCGGTLEVDWTYTDDCNRTITAKKVITVLPAPMAAFDEIEDVSIACEDLASYQPQFLSYSNGGTGLCEISGSVQGEAQPFEGSCGTFDVDFTFTDDCGRTITAKHTITVIDETAPMLVGELPQGESNLDLCFENRPEGPTEAEIAALFEDNCGNVNVTKTVSVPQEDDCHWAVMYRYEIQDDCGNFANPVKVFYNGGDSSAPELTGELPQGTTGLQCYDENPGAPSIDAIAAAFTDNCGTVTVTPLEPVIEGDDCGWTATYEFTIVDACENYADNVVIVNSGADTMPPMLEGEVPMGQNTLDLCADSDLGEPSEEAIAALYADNCSEVTVTKVEKVYGTDCEWIRVFEYTAKDACGNTADLIKVNYQGGDNSAPMPTGACDNETMTIGTEMGAVCPADASISLQIGDEISAGDNSWSVAGITVAQMNGTLVPCFADNCAEVEELTFRVIAKSTAEGDCSTTLTVTFEVEDLCENISEPFTCTFIVVDDTAPVVECPEGQDFGIVAEAPTSFADKAPYTDNCQADGQTQDYSDELTSEITGGALDAFTIFCNVNGSLHSTWNWTLREIDGNGYPIYDASSVPEFPQETGVISYNIDLGRYEMDAYSNGIVYADNVWFLVTDSTTIPCSADGWEVPNQFCVLEFECDDNAGSGSVETFTLVRTFTANDGCGNTDTCEVVYTWTIDSCANDTVNPEIACPADVDVYESTGLVSGVDSVGGEIVPGASFGEVSFYAEVSGMPTDATIQDITIDMNISHSWSGDLEITLVSPSGVEAILLIPDNTGNGLTNNVDFVNTNISFSDSAAAPIAPDAILTDGNNDAIDASYKPNDGTVTFADFIATLSGDQNGTWELYVIDDAAGDVGFIHSWAVNITYGDVDISPDATGYAIASDNCDDEPAVTYSDVSSTNDVGVTTIVRTWTATDESGNSDNCDQIITINPEPILFRAEEEISEMNTVKEVVEIDFVAFPVPFDNEVNIAYSFEFDTDVTIELFDTKGLQILSETNKNYVKGSKGKSTFDLSRYSSQMFYVTLTTSQGSVTKKIVSSGK